MSSKWVYLMVQALEKENESRLEAETLIVDCKALMRRFQDFELVHIYREGNQCADYLANMD